VSDPREAHVFRIQNKVGGAPLADGTPSDQVASDDSIWLDMLRLDKVQIIDPNAKQGLNQTINYILKWQDEADDDPNTRRKLKTLKITNPLDPSQWIKLDVIKQMSIIRPNAKQGLNQTINVVFANDDDNIARQSDVTTIYNTDVSTLDMSKPVDWSDYQPVLESGEQDKSQSLDVEVPNRFKLNDPHASQGLNQLKTYLLKNKDVVDAINQKPAGP
jgi:hypothetical protein